MIGKLLLFVCLALVANAAVHKLKMNTLAGKSLQALKEGKFEEFKKHHKKAINSRLNKNSRASRLSKSQSIDDYGDLLYTVNVTIGTPPQPFQLYLNTYDDSIWIPDISCTDEVCECAGKTEFCYIKNKFDRKESTTFKTDLSSFQDHSTWGTGISANDTIGIANLQVKDFTFGLLDSPPDYFYLYPFDGYLSLSFKTYDSDTKTIIEKAFEQKLIEAPIFTFFLASNGWTSNSQNGGQLTIGEVDKDNCSPDVAYVPVYDQADWTFDILKMEISRKTKGGAWTGRVGTEITTILIPQQAFNDISSTTNAVFNPRNGYYSVDCDVKFEWTLTLANQNKLTITEKKGVTQIDDACYILFEPISDNDLDLFLGSPFLYSYCSVFDMTGKIGFSKVLN